MITWTGLVLHSMNWKMKIYEYAREPSEEELSEYLNKIESDRKQKITENLES